MRDAPDTSSHPIISTMKVLLLGSVVVMSLTASAFPAAATVQKRQDTHSAPAPHPASSGDALLRRAGFHPVAAVPSARLYRLSGFRHASEVSLTARRAGTKLAKNGKGRVYAVRYTEALQCVPFARAASGIELKGNAVNWWDAASGVYERGNRPELGAVLNFRANGGMRLGHVAVVRQIVNSREIEIDHANWAWSGKGNISRGVAVIDVSERNDWTAVRVELGHSAAFGSIYSTYGFIYDRPDTGTMLANNTRTPAPQARDLRGTDEVAEAPSRGGALIDDAPVRSFR